MAKRLLGKKNVDELLAYYRDERRRLNYQLDLVKVAIDDLKQQKAAASNEDDTTGAVAKAVVKRGPGRPRKKAAVAKAPGKPGRPKKRVRKERALNEWDNAVINTIQTTNRLMPKDELLEQLLVWAKANQPGLSEEEVAAFLTRTLQKLSGKKKMLGTHHSGLRRGYHYGLMEWFFQSSGKLRKQHYDKLVLGTEGDDDTAA